MCKFVCEIDPIRSVLLLKVGERIICGFLKQDKLSVISALITPLMKKEQNCEIYQVKEEREVKSKMCIGIEKNTVKREKREKRGKSERERK